MWNTIWVLFVIIWPVAVAALSKSWRDEIVESTKSFAQRVEEYFGRDTKPPSASMDVFATLIEEGRLREAKMYVENHPDDETLQRFREIILVCEEGSYPKLKRQTPAVTVPTTDSSVDVASDDESISEFSIPTSSV